MLQSIPTARGLDNAFMFRQQPCNYLLTITPPTPSASINMRRLAMEVSTASSFALFVFCTILLSVEVLQVYASLDPSLVYSNTTTLNFTAMTILSNSLGITPGATSLPDTVLSSLWSLEDTSTSNDEKCAVF